MTSSVSVLISGDAVIMQPYAVDRPERRALVDLVRGADVAFTELDGLLNDYHGPPAPGIGIHVAASPRVGQELLSTGFNLFSTAGNHGLDYGVDGLRRHIAAMSQLGMRFAGVGETAGQAAQPAFVDANGARVALVAAASSLGAGWPAADPSPGIDGRPGVNALRFVTRYQVDADVYESVRHVARALGAEARERYELEMGYVPPLPAADQVRFLDGIVELAELTRIETEPVSEDVERMTSAIRAARGRADLVMVYLHSHEPGDTDEQPAQFAETFAHACIDAGAHLVAMSGPHVLRGIELYRDLPILYGLGNLWFEYELIERLPREAFAYHNLSPDSTIGDFADHAMLGFQRDARFWESVLPVCTFEGGELLELVLHPVSLGFGLPRGLRGQPEIAEGDRGRWILRRLDRLSDPFGTRIVEAHGVGRVVPSRPARH